MLHFQPFRTHIFYILLIYIISKCWTITDILVSVYMLSNFHYVILKLWLSSSIPDSWPPYHRDWKCPPPQSQKKKKKKQLVPSEWPYGRSYWHLWHVGEKIIYFNSNFTSRCPFIFLFPWNLDTLLAAVFLFVFLNFLGLSSSVLVHHNVLLWTSSCHMPTESASPDPTLKAWSVYLLNTLGAPRILI